ncbi:MAG: S-layer homology domain-containing protein [Peptococcaceae bacterium]|nr:S-layer homology domain-containing protein [Peptococcaceae bacterium]
MLTRRLFVFSMAIILLVQLGMPAPLLARAEQSSAKGTSKPLISLEQAIQTVKGKIEIPTELKDFSSGFSNYNSHQAWYLNWSSEGAKAGSLMSYVDAVSGDILSIHYSKPYTPNQSYKIPDISLQQAEKLADQNLKKLAGDKYQRLKRITDNTIIPLNDYGQTSYSFAWQRTENNIPVPGDGAGIQIDSETGRLMSYNLNWTDLTFAKANTIDATKAAQALSESNLLELRYFLAPEVRPLQTNDKGQEKVRLVYQLKNNGTIDALTGHPVILNQDEFWADETGIIGGMGSKELDSKEATLTPQEQQEIADLAKLLTKEQAIEAVQKWVEIPKDFSIRNMNLYKDSSLRGNRAWSFHWESQNRTQFISAKVNAENGELISFSSYNSSATSSDQTKLISPSEALKIAEDFVKHIQPDKFKQTKLNTDNLALENPNSSEPAAKLPLPDDRTSITFNYQRMVNGILFPANQISATVDLVTKKITSYSLNWWNLEFPELAVAMPKNQAEELFFHSRPMELQYAIVYDQGEAKEARLVYRPAAINGASSDLMDAKSGIFLDWRGKPLTDQPCRLNFNDIADNPYAKEITVLGLAGIFGEYGNEFKPQQNITVHSLLKALLAVKNGIIDNNLSSADIIKEAKRLGWLQEEVSANQIVSKELFSKIIIRYLGLDKIARLNSIFTSSFNDAQTFAPASQGYISLVTGLDIIPRPKDGKFNPDRPVTRAEAAYSIIKALGLGFKY